MKKIFLAFIFGTITLLAQEKLVVEYKFNFDFDLSKITDKKTIDFYNATNQNISFFELVTTKDESYFKRIEKIDNNQKNNNQLALIGGPAGIFYNNLLEKYSLFGIDLNGKKLIVKDTLKPLEWVLTKDKIKILGYEVRKATYQKDKFIVEAWYSPELVFKNGPNKYYGLPGIILKIEETIKSDIGDHKQVYTAISVRLDNKVKIDKPTKGQFVTQKEFEQIIDEMNNKLNEMQSDKVDKKID